MHRKSHQNARKRQKKSNETQRICIVSHRFAEETSMAEKAAAPKAKVETVSSKQLAQALAEKHELSKKQANQIMEDLTGLITKQLKKGTRIRLNGLGILQVRKRSARMGRNPATGEAIKIKASKKVAFRVAKELKT